MDTTSDSQSDLSKQGTHGTMSSFDSSDDERDNYDDTPLLVDWLDLSELECMENLGISALPGCRFKETWRKLQTDIDTVKSYGIKEVFVLCTKGELSKYRVPSLLHELSAADITVHHYPFPDGCTPPIHVMFKMIEEIRVNLSNGRKTLVHCFGGLGRSCLVAVYLLMMLDPTISSEDAIQKLRDLRGPGAIQTVKQYNFIHDFHENLAKFEKNKENNRSVSR